MGKGRSPVAQKRGRANCLPRQRTLLLASDPFRRALAQTNAQTHARTHLLHPNSLRHCPSPSCPMQAGWTLTSAAATFLQREGGARGGKEGRGEEGERGRERKTETEKEIAREGDLPLTTDGPPSLFAHLGVFYALLMMNILKMSRKLAV